MTATEQELKRLKAELQKVNTDLDNPNINRLKENIAELEEELEIENEPEKQMKSIFWRGVQIEITFTPNAFRLVEHIEICTENNIPLPVTETGYRSNFTEKGTVAQHGGLVEFVNQWLDNVAQETGWNGAQPSLF